jgi:hypothetical protein
MIEVAENMQRFVVKFDARRRDLITSEEQQAYREAIRLMVGEKWVW